MQPCQESVDLAFVLAIIGQEFAQGLFGKVTETLVVMLAAGSAEDAQIGCNQLIRMQGIERRQQHTPRQIPRRAEQQQGLAMLAHKKCPLKRAKSRAIDNHIAAMSNG